MSRTPSDDLLALRDDYISRVNTVLGQGREDLAGELAAAYEVDRTVLTSRRNVAARSQNVRCGQRDQAA